ncbi:MAG: ATP-binding protein [Opitutales bacterium]|nr:ATP-binding protein [Opitutales bacterium]
MSFGHTKWLVIVIHLLLPFQITRAAHANLEDLAFLGVHEGLRSVNIYSFFRDSNGLLWIGTDFGLHTYDGAEIRQFASNNNEVNLDNRITELFEWKGKLLIGGYFPGLVTLDLRTHKFEQITFTEDPEFSGYTYDFCIEDDEHLLIATADSGVYRIHSTTWEGEFVPTSKGRVHAKNLVRTDKGEIWMNSWRGGVFRYDKKKLSFERIQLPAFIESIPNLRFNEADITENGEILISLWEVGLLIITGITDHQVTDYQLIEEKDGLAARYVLDIVADDKGNIWAGTNNGLSGFSRDPQEKGRWQLSAKLLGQTKVSELKIDKEGLLWIGTKGMGLTSIPSDFLYQESSMSHDKRWGYVRSLADFDETYWVGAAERGMILVNKSTGATERLYDTHKLDITPANRSKLDQSLSEVVLYELGGQKFLVTGREGASFNIIGVGNNLFLEYRAQGFYNVYDIEVDDQNRLWVAHDYRLTIFEPVFDKIDPHKTFEQNFRIHNPPKRSILDSKVNVIHPSGDGGMWIGSNSVGLIKMSTSHGHNFDFQDYVQIPVAGEYSEKDQRGCAIGALYSDDHTLWVGTRDQGLFKMPLTRGVLEPIDQPLSLRESQIQAIDKDSDGNIWIGTPRGFYRYNDSFNLYMTNSGSGVRNLWQESIRILQDKTLVVGAHDGLLMLNLKDVYQNTYIPGVSVSAINVFSGNDDKKQRQINASSLPVVDGIPTLQLKYPDFATQIKLSVLSYRNPSRNEIRYKIDEQQRDWTQLKGAGGIINLNNLKAGSQVITIMCSNDSGIWNPEPLQLRITYRPAFWVQIWFWVGVALIFFSLIIIYLRMKTIRERRRNAQLERLVESRTSSLDEQNQKLESLLQFKNRFLSVVAHDLKNPLSMFVSYSELMNQNYDEETEEERRSFVKIVHQTSLQLHNLLERLLEFGTIGFETQPTDHDTPISLFELVGEVNSCYESNPKSINVINGCTPSTRVIGLKQYVEFIIRNLVGNGIKFTQDGGKIEVYDVVEDSQVWVCVKDNGIGMTKAQIDSLFDSKKMHSITRTENTSGFGLIACKEFVDRMGGAIRIESEPDLGSVFSFSLKKAPRNYSD